MSGRSVNSCHKTRIENCKGNLLSQRSEYGKWAYWCAKIRKGWLIKSCDCKDK